METGESERERAAARQPTPPTLTDPSPPPSPPLSLSDATRQDTGAGAGTTNNVIFSPDFQPSSKKDEEDAFDDQRISMNTMPGDPDETSRNLKDIENMELGDLQDLVVEEKEKAEKDGSGKEDGKEPGGHNTCLACGALVAGCLGSLCRCMLENFCMSLFRN